MGVLNLVRHGQATPFEKETDRLSPLGELQAGRLADFWIRRQVVFDEVYSGSLVRQRRTAEIVGERYAEAGLPWPGLQTTADLNEYDGAGILALLASELEARDAEFCRLVEKARENAATPERNRHFQRMFEAVMAHWVAGTLTSPQVESWQGFRTRVYRAIDGITSRPGSNRRVVVFTSGGPIGATVQRAVNAPPVTGIDINWRVRNSSITEFLFSGGRMTLDTFNATPHLEEPELHSFR